MLFGIYLNVCMMNYSFSVGVLYFALFLLIMTIFLLYPYFKNLANAFIFQKPTTFKTELNSTSKYNAKSHLLITIGLIILSSFTCNTINAIKQFKKNKIAKETTHIFKVTEHIVANETLPGIENSKNRWRYWMEYELENKKALIIYSMDINNRLRYFISKDTLNNKIILTPQKSNETAKQNDTLNYIKKPNDEVVVDGKFNNKNITILLQKFSIDSFPLLKQKPHFLPRE